MPEECMLWSNTSGAWLQTIDDRPWADGRRRLSYIGHVPFDGLRDHCQRNGIPLYVVKYDGDVVKSIEKVLPMSPLTEPVISA